MEEEEIRQKVEKRENNSKRKEKVKKIKLKVEPKEGTESVLDLYNTKIKKIHLITLAVVFVLYLVSFILTFSGIGATTSLTTDTIKEQLQYTFFFSFVIVLAGTVPFFYLSFGGVAQLMSLLSDFGARYTLSKSYAISLFLGGAINCIGIALCMAAGFYLCYLTTKKRKYYSASEFGMSDIKLQLYQIRQNKEKIQEINKQKIKKAKEAEDCNVKIPYIKLGILGVVGFAIQMIGLLISKI